MPVLEKFSMAMFGGGTFRVSMSDAPESLDPVEPSSSVVISSEATDPALNETSGSTHDTSTLLSPVADVTVTVSVVLGETQMTVRDATRISEGKIIPLDRQIDDPLQLLVNGYPVAHGEVVQVDNQFSLRITETLNSEAEKGERF